jgi:hypothetical protein
MVVSDENGKLEKRYYGNGAQCDLLSENKKELIDKKLDEAKNQLEKDKKVKKMAKAMLKFQPTFVVLVTGAAFLITGIKDMTNFNAAIEAAFRYLISSSCVAGVSAIYFHNLEKKYKNILSKDGLRIDAIRKIKNDFEKEQNRIKEHEYKRGGVYPNQIFNLDKDTQMIENNLDDQIETEYEELSSMKLSLRRK